MSALLRLGDRRSARVEAGWPLRASPAAVGAQRIAARPDGRDEQVAALEKATLSIRGRRYSDDDHGPECCGESGSIGDAELDVDVMEVALDRSR
jgi:hypothetical protein